MEEVDDKPYMTLTPKLLAEGQPDRPYVPSNVRPEVRGLKNHYKYVEWTADGTCIITNSADNSINTHIIPPELLDDRDDLIQLQLYSTIPSKEAVSVVAGYPLFNLQDVSTCMILSAANEHPIRLSSALTGGLVASYPLISPTTEVHIRPHSLLFTADASKFLVGSEHFISVFDISAPGHSPITSLQTGPRRSKGSWSNPGTSMRGFVSALAVDNQYNVLAAGTLSRRVGLYDSAGSGECVGVFSVDGTDADKAIGGHGITQIVWSPCGRYLYIAERKSDGVMLYDIRKSGQLLGWLSGRDTITNQRMGINLVDSKDGSGHQIWAGGNDGYVRCWNEPYLSEGSVAFSFQFKSDEDNVNGIAFHQTGNVFATVSGQREFDKLDENKDQSTQGNGNALRVWSM